MTATSWAAFRPISRWNDKFRDAVRGYWLRRAWRAASWPGVYRPQATVPPWPAPSRRIGEFVAVHDGFTLADV